MDIFVNSSDEAITLCKQLQAEGKADLFRGQIRDWDELLPSLLRPNIQQTVAQQQLDEFLDWSRIVPQMVGYRESEESLIAIAQHYGIPTRFLDLTDNPEVAANFSKAGLIDKHNPTQSVIYCFSEKELSQTQGFHIVRINVFNLWRLEAQQGLFLRFAEEKNKINPRELAIRIHFPTEAITERETRSLYPTRKSQLEIVIDQWIYRNQIQSLVSSLAIPKRISIKRNTYPGTFRWRSVPPLEPSWFGHEPRWIFPVHEPYDSFHPPVTVTIPALDLSSPERAMQTASEAIRNDVIDFHLTNKKIAFSITVSQEHSEHAKSISKILDWCWDGLHTLPYSHDEVLASMSLIIALLCGRTERVEDINDWPEKLWSSIELIDVAPAGGHLEAGIVSKKTLHSALLGLRSDKFVQAAKKLLREGPDKVMDYVVDVWLLFDFAVWRKMFVEQFIPTAIDGFWREDLANHEGKLGALWSISFNPVLIGFVTNFSYRFTSPCALRSDVEQIIYVTPSMERDEIEEVFFSCLPDILAGSGKPYRLTFSGYSDDPRGLWDIEHVIDQSQQIVELAGISVLEVTSLLGAKPEGNPTETVNWLGAFEVWLIAKRQMKEFGEKEITEQKALYDEFWDALILSNEQIEAHAKRELDWPLREAAV